MIDLLKAAVAGDPAALERLERIVRCPTKEQHTPIGLFLPLRRALSEQQAAIAERLEAVAAAEHALARLRAAFDPRPPCGQDEAAGRDLSGHPPTTPRAA
jgi:hypothetical protein